MSEQKEQVKKINEAFNQEFGRFANLQWELNTLNLADAKISSRFAAESRVAFGWFDQTVERVCCVNKDS